MSSTTSITSANSVYMLAILGLFPAPQRLEGYAADAAFDIEAAEPAEVRVGVDGKVSAGYTPYLTKQTISLMADSQSNYLFEEWIAAQKLAREVLWATATIAIVATGRKYALSQGVLTSIMALPSAKKVLDNRVYGITWGSIDPAAL